MTGRPDLQMLSVYRDHGVVPKDSRDDNHNRDGADLSAYQTVRPGDVVANKMKTWQGSIAVSRLEGLVSPAYIVCEANRALHPRFLHYLLRSQPYIAEYRKLSYGVRPAQWDLRWEDLRDVRLATPPARHQAAIADFLDRETERIDRLVEKKRRLIELLEEKRTALISQAVTKGLNPSAPMKDSGIPWLRTIPDAWQVRPLKRVARFREGPGIMAVDFRDEGVPLLRIGNLVGDTVELEGCNFVDPVMARARWQHLKVRAGELLISASASTGNAVLVPPTADGAVPYTGLIRLWPVDAELDLAFLRVFLSSTVFRSQVDQMKTGVGITHWGPTHLMRVLMPVPPVSEQRLIASRIATSERVIGQAVSALSTQLGKLAEYRQALITAAVTGQMDISAEPTDSEEVLV